MDDNAKVIIVTKFTEIMRGSDRCLSPVGLRHRVKVYLAYTVGSLLRQEDPRVQPWLNCRPGTETMMEEYVDIIEEAGVKVTFDRGAAWRTEMLAQGITSVYTLRIDSDDMYDPRAIRLLRLRQIGYQAAQWCYGYIWRVRPQSLQYYDTQSPPFYSQFADVTVDKFKTRFNGSHTRMARTEPMLMPDRSICVVQHGVHSGRAHRGRNVPQAEASVVRQRLQLDNPVAFWRQRNSPKILKLLTE
jgi:hypothetical protein